MKIFIFPLSLTVAEVELGCFEDCVFESLGGDLGDDFCHDGCWGLDLAPFWTPGNDKVICWNDSTIKLAAMRWGGSQISAVQ